MNRPDTDSIVTIRDPRSGSRAQLHVGLGFNCFRFQIPQRDHRVDVLWAEPEFESGERRPSGSGIPILFPFPGRIGGASMRWQGRDYPLSPSDGRGNAIHGFVFNRPWRVTEQADSQVSASFQASVDDPSILDSWPADFRVTATFRIEDTRLTADVLVQNPDRRPLPFGLGLHPYFRVPLGGRDETRCVARLPVGRKWELVDMLPTGHSSALPDDLRSRYRQGIDVGSLALDDVFSDLDFRDGGARASIEDLDSRLRMTLGFDASFTACVVYNPPHREALCIEPYTCVPDAVRLADEGIDAGLRVLAPGGSFQARMAIGVDVF